MNMDDLLFDLSEIANGHTPPPDDINVTCGECEHRQRWECGSKIIQYCGKRKSNRTDNGLLKIKCKNKACALFEFRTK